MGLGGRGAAMAVNMIVLAITSRLLTPVEFGEFAICQVIVDLGQAASASFISISLLQRSRMRSGEFYLALTVTLIVALLAGVALALVAPWLAGWLKMPALKLLLLTVIPILALRIMASFYIGVLQRRVWVGAVVRAQSISQVASPLLITLPLAWAGWGTWSLIAGLGVTTALELGLLVARARVPLKFTLKGSVATLFRHGWPSLASRMLLFASDSVDRIVVGRAFGAYALGIYSRSANIVRLPVNLLGLPLQNALLAWFSRHREKDEMVGGTIRLTVAVQSYLFPIALVSLWLATPMIVLLMLGTQWQDAIPVAQVLFVGSLVRLGTIPLESASTVLGYAWGSASRQVTATAVLAVGLVLAAMREPLWIAYAVSCSRVVYYLLSLNFGMRVFALPAIVVAKATLGGLMVSCAAALPAVLVARYSPLQGIAQSVAVLASFTLTAGVITIFFPSAGGRPVSEFIRTGLASLAGRIVQGPSKS